jgi:hypothetical protein
LRTATHPSLIARIGDGSVHISSPFCPWYAIEGQLQSYTIVFPLSSNISQKILYSKPEIPPASYPSGFTNHASRVTGSVPSPLLPRFSHPAPSIQNRASRIKHRAPSDLNTGKTTGPMLIQHRPRIRCILISYNYGSRVTTLITATLSLQASSPAA